MAGLFHAQGGCRQPRECKMEVCIGLSISTPKELLT
jgi:hypothetical protein